MIDRFGTRPLLTGVALALGLPVLGMSYASGVAALFVALVLIRGLGQGALSVVSHAQRLAGCAGVRVAGGGDAAGAEAR